MSTSKPTSAPSRPGDGLTRDAVLAAALALIDRKGVAAFSVRDLARELGVYPTALYWHVPGRNALIAGAVALALGDLKPTRRPADWAAGVRTLFRRYRKAVRAHPAIAPVLGAQLVSNESMPCELVEHMLALLERAGFSGDRLRHAYNTLVAGMVGFVTLELAPLPEEDPEGWAKAHRQRMQSVNARQCPTLAREMPHLARGAFVVRASSGVDQPLEQSFEFWTETVIQGLAAMRERSAPGPAQAT
ncbi:TetR/AcrR family transcriptional regulator [Hydrogenophaga sp.]|jgi:AcrR family transcriptional regulator|uniref:TetR/AcrR family transcriptional regulator n=1 Tax=Hydrogenophaga sp. TaxID=1904254 RepID=UPI002723121B|nr:TetR/AcrR family transcriptional regulator C-terminal domain-containing protein [Hydrogenophaga sp.]MDO9251277.1 TetR/AcrR family transcriptional regulator C-terminal domain-containing protein [Hydrogenophaga sp.]MDP3323910.1 TetR/AcrR family transcriptional regulator C-terminal domain-containing protein [Hydrogenophaga sp.]MDP3883945.1 TetR/AcrR family transcriptional regulator C-terminal domain-containing protein [Hydrogenophaga sp.]